MRRCKYATNVEDGELIPFSDGKIARARELAMVSLRVPCSSRPGSESLAHQKMPTVCLRSPASSSSHPSTSTSSS